ncbi:MAG: outer membrane protein assembly factor BamD [Acidobacteria bacterium]|nr:outer membrane protein assembly factor BamD [Acidobacteriota bacterium]
MINGHRLVFLSLVFVALVGCSSTSREEELLTELTDMNKSEIFEKAETLYAAGKTEDARNYFSFVYDTFPNDPLGHKAALRVADTFAAKKDAASLTEARLRYRDFANRYPNDPDRDYALLMVGQTYSSRQMKPDRDLSTVEEALSAYRQLLTLYPDSQYHAEAESRIGKLLDVLAEHELITAQFYARNKRWLAARWRLEYLKEHYPDFGRMAEADALLEKVHEALTDAQEHFRKMIEEKKRKAEKLQQATQDKPPAETPH